MRSRISDGPMSHHCSPQSLHLLHFFFLAFTLTCSNFPGSKSAGMLPMFCPEYPEYIPSGTPRRQSRIPGIPVQSLNFPESAPIPAGIPDP